MLRRMRRNPYGFSVDVNLNADDAESLVRRLLLEEGLTVLTKVDVGKTLKEHRGWERRDFRILGAHDPAMLGKALELEPAIGLVSPCTVVFDSSSPGATIVSFLDPLIVLAMVGDPRLHEIAADASSRLMRVARHLTQRRVRESAAVAR
jgi:uncharacterized protein (DUF302 family)